MTLTETHVRTLKPRTVLVASVLTQIAISGLFQGLPALAPALQTTFGMTTGSVGLVLGAVNAAAAVVVIMWGRLLDRVSDRLVAAMGLFGGAIFLGCAARGAAVDAYAVTVTAIVLAGAMAVAPYVAITIGMTRAFAGTARFGLAFGIRQAAVPFGGVLAGVTLPVIAYNRGLSAALAVLAIIMLLCGAGLLMTLRREGRRPDRAVRPAAQWQRIIPLLTSCTLYTFTQIGVISLLTLFLFNERGWDSRAAAFVFACVMGSVIVTRIIVGHLVDRLIGRSLAIYRTIGVITAVLLFGAAFTVHLPVVVPLIVLAAVFAMSWNPLIFTLTVGSVPPERLGATQGVLTATLFLGGGLAPILIAPMIQATSWSVGWAALAAVSVAGAAISPRRSSQSR